MSIFCNSKEELDKLLCSIPYEWRKGIVDAIDAIINCPLDDICIDIKKCQTVTFISGFEYKDGKLIITYIDENGVSTKSTVDISITLDNLLADVSLTCLPEDWTSLSFKDKVQFIIDNHCTCCPPTTTTTTTTTTSTTTTTTAPPCPVVTDIEMTGEVI
jgi:hypothetical protein